MHQYLNPRTNRKGNMNRMIEQTPTPNSLKGTRKSLLVIGIILLFVGFFFFYQASRNSWDNPTFQNSFTRLAYPTHAYNYSQFGHGEWGYAYEYFVDSFIILPDNDITVSYSTDTPLNDTIHIVVYDPFYADSQSILASSDTSSLYFLNNGQNTISYEIDIVAQNTQNATLSVTIEFHHYEPPQWNYFSIGVALSLLSVIPIFKAKK
jgi:hypothetical protein